MESASLSRVAIGLDPRATAVTLDDPLADAQTKTEAVRPWPMRAAETLEDELLALGRDSETTIPHRNVDRLAILLRDHVDRPTVWRIVDRIREQIREDLLDAVPIRCDSEVIRRSYTDGVLLGQRLHSSTDLEQERGQVEPEPVHFEEARLEAIHVEEVADQSFELIDLFRDDREGAGGAVVG
jgi:hypothetical protein